MKLTRFLSVLMSPCVVLSLAVLLNNQSSYAQPALVHQTTLGAGESWCPDSWTYALFGEINTLRAQNGIPALTVDSIGMKDADIRAVQLVAYLAANPQGSTNFYPHTGYDTVAAGLGYNIQGENLAWSGYDPFSIWTSDSLHLNAMLDYSANVAGISCVQTSVTSYWTYEPGYNASAPASSSTTPAQNTTPSPTTGATLTTGEAAFLTLINNYRQQNGAPALQVSQALQNSSTWMSLDMALNNLTAHVDSLGRDPSTRLPAYGYSYGTWGENVAGGFPDAASVLSAWQGACDPDGSGNCTYAHRTNMLNPNFRVIGIGQTYDVNSQYGTYWVTDFGGVVDQTISSTPTPTPGPVIGSFTANPSTVSAGGVTLLSWNVPAGTTVTINNGVGAVSGDSSAVVGPLQTTTTYTLTATNTGGGSSTAQVLVTVGGSGGSTPPASGAPVISSFTATPSTTTAGQIATLSWNVSGATTISINNGVGTVSSGTTALVAPVQTTTYTLTATNSNGTSTAQVVVTVNAPGTTGAAPVISSFAASPSTITAGQIATLSWNVSGATTISINNGVGTIASGTTALVTPAQTTTYTLTATNGSGSSTAQVVVTVNPAVNTGPAILSFTASPSTIAAGQTTTLSWNVPGATSLKINNGVGIVTYQTSVTLQLVQTTTYTLTATNNSGTSTATIVVTVNSGTTVTPAPVISSFTASPSTITAGQTATLSWNVSGAASLSINNGVGGVSGSSVLVQPAQTTTYTLTASNSGGTTTAQVVVTVNAVPVTPAPTVTSFTASPSTITAGHTTTLSWSVSGATSLSINNGVGTVSGSSVVVQPAQTTTYTLTASNSGGSTTAQATVTVTAAVDTQPPSAPVLVSATAKSSSEVDLGWTASTDNVAVTGYQIFRNGAVLTSVSAGTLTYADTTVSANTAYTYTVKAYDAAGNYSQPSNGLSVTTPPAPTVATCPGPAMGAFTGCYYNNTNLAGNPVLVRTDNQINFNWGSGSPASSLTPQNFSARWQGVFNFNAGSYEFSIYVSDGMQFYIDGVPIRSAWRNEPPSLYVVTQTLNQGNHLITLEYYDQSATATAVVSWPGSTAPASPSTAPTISSFSASPATVTAGQSSTLSWNVSGATSMSIDNGVGAVSGTSTVVSPSQTTTYTLTATNSTGSTTAQALVTMTAGVDTQPPSTPYLASAVAKSATEVDLGWTASTDNVGVAGYQILRNGMVLGSVAGSALAYADTTASANTSYSYAIKAYDAAGNYSGLSNSIAVSTPAVATTSACPGPAMGAFTGCYYNNTELAGNPVLVRTDNQINFNWGSGSPASNVTPLNFSVQWQGIFNFAAAGGYTFSVTVSDGMQLYIDGVPVRSAWRNQSPNLFLVTETLTQGNHLITLDYYEQTGTATAVLSWQQTSSAAPTTPTTPTSPTSPSSPTNPTSGPISATFKACLLTAAQGISGGNPSGTYDGVNITASASSTYKLGGLWYQGTGCQGGSGEPLDTTGNFSPGSFTEYWTHTPSPAIPPTPGSAVYFLYLPSQTPLSVPAGSVCPVAADGTTVACSGCLNYTGSEPICTQ